MTDSDHFVGPAGAIAIDLSPEIRTAVRRRLEQELVAVSRRTAAGWPAVAEEEDVEPTDTSAQQTIDLERDLGAAHDQRTHRLLDDIADALERLDAGTFGICDACGNLIEQARLLALPHARRCLGCQRRVESRRR
jgi:RNA polymerase-binding transcription factor